MTDAERAVREPIERIRKKCSQYWNEVNVGDVEWHAILEFIHGEVDAIDRAIEAVRDETFRNTYADANEEGCKRGRRDENEACAKLCDHPTNMLRDIEPCTAMNHEEDCHGKDATAIRARIGKEGE